jgi:flagellar export protein FliJ
MSRKLKILRLLSWYRGLQEEQSKVRVYNARVNLQKLMEEKKILEEEYEESYEHLKEKRAFSGEELKNWGYYLGRLMEFREIADKKVEMQEGILSELKEELQKRHQEKRLMERLTQKTQLQLSLEALKREWKALDDLIIMRRGRSLD